MRRPAGRSVVVVSPRIHRPFYLRPFYYPSFYYSPGFFYGYGGFYAPYYWAFYGQYRYPPYGWRYPIYDTTGSARIQVSPRTAEVFVDGYFVGTVDDFDGYLQRLHVPAGEHELTFFQEGYKTVRQKVLFRPRATVKIAFAMEGLGPGDAMEPRPTPDESARGRHDPARRPYVRGQSNYGTLALRVQPDDATVLVDGEHWDRPEGEDRFMIDLPEGTHQIEVSKEGLRTYRRTIEIRRGQTITLNVSLTLGGAVPAMAAR